MLAGCAAAPPADTADPARARSPDAAHVRSVLVGDERGLEVRQWLVIERADALPQVLAGHRETIDDRVSHEALPPDAAERLRHNGLRLVRVPAEAVDAIAAELGLALERIGRHGQVLQWTELHATPATPAAGGRRAVAIDGRVRVFDRGTFQLMSRSWVVQMEDGPYVQLELLPQFREPDDPYRRLLTGRQGSIVTAWPSMGVDLLLEPGFAYILLSESPSVDWAVPSDKAADANETGARRPSRRERGPDLGPDAPAPTTIGELMLSSDGPGARGRSRGMLVFVPHVAREFNPPAGDGVAERATTGSARR